MSHACFAEALASAEVHYKMDVMKHTWGHLARKRNKRYFGHITFAVGCFGSDRFNPMPLECSLIAKDGEELDSSPWFYDSMIDFLQSLGKENQEGTVWRFEGNFHNYHFDGIIAQAELNFDV